MYIEKSNIAEATRKMFGMVDDEETAATRNDSLPAGIRRDEHDVQSLVEQFERFNTFRKSTDSRCISTNDFAPEDVKEGLLHAKKRGTKLVQEFVNDRLLSRNTSFYAPLHRNKSQTFACLTEVMVQIKDDRKVVKADRNLFHRLLVVPLSELGGSLRQTAKSALADILQEHVHIRRTLPKDGKKTCLLIDGPALIQAIGKPSGARTFGDLSDVFCDSITRKFGPYKRIDVLFDRYEDFSIKNATRVKRGGKACGPIRKIVDNSDVPLPHSWKNFISLPSNKSDLADFLSMGLVAKMEVLPPDVELVTAGGFSDATKVVSSKNRDLSSLMANHEEADTD